MANFNCRLTPASHADDVLSGVTKILFNSPVLKEIANAIQMIGSSCPGMARSRHDLLFYSSLTEFER